jgi:hypothetical protein
MTNLRALAATFAGSMVAVCSLTGVQTAYAAGRQAVVKPLFRPLLPALARTRVPAYLPTVFPEKGTARLYASMYSARPGLYEVYIEYTPNCDGGDACHYGDLEGRRRAASGGSLLRGALVDLGHHVTGYFVLGGCGASCAESTISWRVGSYAYEIGAKLSRADLIAFTRSAIGAGAYPASVTQ